MYVPVIKSVYKLEDWRNSTDCQITVIRSQITKSLLYLHTVAGFIGAKDDGSGGDNWSYETCKAPVKSSPPTPNFLQAGCPSCRQTNNVKALKQKFFEHES